MSQVEELLTETHNTLVDQTTDLSEYIDESEDYPRYLAVFQSLYISKTTNTRNR